MKKDQSFVSLGSLRRKYYELDWQQSDYADLQQNLQQFRNCNLSEVESMLDSVSEQKRISNARFKWSTGLTASIKPLKRLLASQVNRQWADVLKLLDRKIPSGLFGNKVRKQVEKLIHLNPPILDGIASRWYWNRYRPLNPGTLYVDSSGMLRAVPQYCAVAYYSVDNLSEWYVDGKYYLYSYGTWNNSSQSYLKKGWYRKEQVCETRKQHYPVLDEYDKPVLDEHGAPQYELDTDHTWYDTFVEASDHEIHRLETLGLFPHQG